ncbi:carbohydrate ABC transporter membrane protein 1, CUT1 family [Actinacidiphila yanglinensis]|uniref:Carbohydrate ABC transporter membrane protein 1, CUT1 family n=1 Tax=Actinacidiphila yanglinensis TaxID=310779 RepID=A0A1H6E284_9ACTN|nr:sugar ABC transporter permease [Actinacidiphila yanglinensis]SEG91730.1 carbohydrate ABC transporter membrane protein 1, CUT1 family [Actinacidiphila yanglinensis]
MEVLTTGTKAVVTRTANRRSEGPVRAPRQGGVRRAVWVGAFLAPAVALVAALLVVPFAVTAYRSLFDDNGITARFVGLANYRSLLTDPDFGRSLLNTVMWVVGTLVLPVLLGLLLAVLTHSVRWGAVARTAVVIPYALSGSATALLWTYLLKSDGAVNQTLSAVGLGGWQQDWLLHWPLNTVVMIVATTWQSTGAALLLFLIGLQTIPAETIEAARIDGAQGLQMFLKVIVPQLRPMTVVVVGMSIVNSLKTFDIVWLLTQGGPGTASETLALTMYRQTFTLNRYGYGAAVSVVLTAVVVAASWLYLRRQVQPQRGGAA